MIDTAVEWTNVLVALIAGLPGIIAAVASLLIRREVHSAAGGKLSEKVDAALSTAQNTNALVRSIDGVSDVPPPPKPPGAGSG